LLTDYQILRIQENADVSTIKSAYRKIVKEIHPDVTHGSFEKHLLFIQINQAYQRLMHRHKADAAPAAIKLKTGISKETGIIQHKDPAYVFYKAGMKEYMKIHPSQWNAELPNITENPGPEDFRKLEEIKEKVRNLVKGFPKAYYYFSIVVHEYPGSVWYQDALEKMTLIEERTIRYKKIIESFTGHAKSVPLVNKMFFNKKK
jgi:hypothetical protein